MHQSNYMIHNYRASHQYGFSYVELTKIFAQNSNHIIHIYMVFHQYVFSYAWSSKISVQNSNQDLLYTQL